jgi:hypothetical protein
MAGLSSAKPDVSGSVFKKRTQLDIAELPCIHASSYDDARRVNPGLKSANVDALGRATSPAKA